MPRRLLCETLVALYPCLGCCTVCAPKKVKEFEDITYGEAGGDEGDLEAEAEEAKLMNEQCLAVHGPVVERDAHRARELIGVR